MKRICYSFALWLTFTATFAQSGGVPYTAKQDSIRRKVPKITMTDVSTLLPQITPKSPNVAAMERYGTIPVSMYTGLPSIEIPIFEFKIGSLSVPIKLTYHASGNKVNDNASWVGLGWTLQAGGSISRIVKGKRDEDDFSNNNSLLQNQLPADYANWTTSIPCLIETLETELNQYSDFGKDSERDIFSCNLPSKSNSFVLLPSAPNYIWQQSDRSKISYTGPLSSFSLTDENGFRFDFQDQESTNSYISAWQLNTIQGTKPTEKAIFTYISNPQITFNTDIIDTEIYKTDVGGTNYEYGGTAGFQSGTTTTQFATVNSKLLNEIFFPNGKIVFVSSPNRADNLGRSLDRIEIYGFNVNTNSYSLIKQFVLNQSYKDGRLFLDSVDLKSNTGATIGTYSCNYNPQTLPDKDSRSKDFWGYYNGQNNATLIHAQTFVANELEIGTSPTTFNVGSNNSSGIGANRNPNETLMQARILTKLTYPTGGFTDFEYEAHRYDGGQMAGGLRIKSIVSNDGNGTVGVPKTITKTYKYGINESGNGTYRDIWLNIPNKTYASVQTHIHKTNIPVLPDFPDYRFKIWVFSSAFTQPMNPNEGSVVTYPVVTEYDDNGSGSNGKTVYTYKDDVGDELIAIPAAAKQMQKSRHWNRGQLLNKVIYGNDNRKKYEQINTYATILSEESPILGYLIAKSIIPLAGFGLYGGSNCQSFEFGTTTNYNYTPIRQYKWATGLVKQVRTEEYSYDDTDDTKFVYKKSETDYDNTYFQAKVARNYQSDGKINIQKYRYVTDYDTHNSGSFNLYSTLYWMRENNQINIPIEQISLVRMSSESENRVLNGQITDFLTSSYGGFNYVYPKEIYLFENPYFPTPVYESNYSLSYLSVGILWKDFRFIKRLQTDTYDNYGNLLSYKLVGGSVNVFTHTTTLLDNVFHSFPTTETKNFGGSTAFTTTFSYDIPLLGLKEITAPNGLKAYFEYDNFGRFKRAKDHDGHILKEHDYNVGLGNNFVKELMPRVSMGLLSGNYNNYQTSINYFDGLGRPLQTVNLQAGFNASNDIVTNTSVYDNLGRIEKSYIPFSNVGGGAIAPPPTVVHGDTAPYSNVSEYDNSPLNRPKKSFGVGQAWRSANKFIESKYLIVDENTITKYDLTSNGAVLNGTWNISLFKSISVSERGKETIEYKDNQGKLIQKDVQDGNNSYTSTHYIYDEFDRLKYVIQPESFKTPQNFTENDTYFKAGVFAYKYDKRGRIIESHVPSGGWVYHIFDVLDREVLRQTEKQRQDGLNRWKFMKFDAINRTLQKGELTNSDSRNDLQTLFDGITNAYEDGNTNQSFPSSVNNQQNREVFLYDNYDFIAGEWAFNSVTAYHTNYSNPKGLLTGIVSWNSKDFNKIYHSVLHYDNKNRLIQSYQTHQLGGAEPWKKAIISNFQYNFSGQITTQNITHQKDNAPNIEDKTENEYDHVGRLTKVFHGINGNRFEVARFTYDAVGRLVQKKIRGDANFLVGGAKDYIRRPSIDGIVIQSNILDLARKAIILEPNLEINAITLNSYLGQIDPNAPQGVPINGLQTIDYQYHIRNWLTGINLDANQNPTPNVSDGDLFSYKLSYEDAGFYDGNIGKQSWKTSKDNALRYYDFNYDDANRLLSANYTGINGENFSLPNFSYDKNGNISNLQRNGKTGSGFGLMDNLTYSYNGNRLNDVTDAISGDHDVDFVPRGANAYTYYNDGSLKSDDNKEITNIIYDTYLDKPTEIQLTNGRWLKMAYNGSGTLLNREFSTSETWDFVSNIIHKNGVLYQMATPEGRATYANNNWNYEFFYQDHLGNTRVSFSADGQNLIVNDISDFDPTGIQLKGIGIENATENRFKWQNKESLALFGLSGINDVDARYADKTINRWWGVDALSDQMRRHSPYNINFNNPLRFIDTDGLSPLPIDDYYDNQTGKYLGSDGASTNNSRLISSSSYNQISQANGGTTSSTATNSLQESSKIITINDRQIQSDIQGVRDNSRSSGVEHSVYITLNPETATISTVKGPTGDNGTTTIEYERTGNTSFMTSGETNQVTGTSILIGQAHGHPETDEPGMVNVPSTSPDIDKPTSISSGITIYAIDSYSGKKTGGVGAIHRVTPYGTQTNFVGKTIGTGTTSNFNIGLDALQQTGGKIK